MEITVDGMKIFYERYEGDGTPVVIMHGWGADSAVMKSLFDLFKSLQRSVISLDLPFFGKSDPPPKHFTVYDYAQTVISFLKALNCNRVTLLGHSFGGRLAIIIGATKSDIATKSDTATESDIATESDTEIKNDIASGTGIEVEKIILLDSAGCKPRFSLKRKLKIWTYKLKKLLKIPQKNSGSTDYQRLPQDMKGVFVRVVNTHLEKHMKKITAPTLIIWGQDDADTPIYMAKRMGKLIKSGALITLENAAHYSFLDRPQETALILTAFIKS